MHYIYKITNKINGKIYIGKTSKTIQQRFIEHCNTSKNINKICSIVHLAMNKYGIENFTVTKICNCKDNEQANKAEILFIKLYKSTDNEIGYNISPGGDGCDLTNPIILQKLKDKTKEAMATPKVKANLMKGLEKYRSENPNWREVISKTNKDLMNSKEMKEKISKPKKDGFKEMRRQAMLGKTPWNKGLTKETDKRVAANGLAVSKAKVN